MTVSGLFSHWFSGVHDTTLEATKAVRPWAEAQGWRFAASRGAEGFVVEPAKDAAWRAEWGPSQREYIGGNELRVRAEIGATRDLQMLVTTRALAQRLEQEVFEQYTEGNQTRMDDATPEEMRWLVLYAKAPKPALGKLHDRFVVLANRPAAVPLWLEGTLARQLEASSEWLDASTPMALVVQRGRFVLRLALAVPSVDVIQSAIGLASVAASAARRVGAEVARGTIGSQRPSSWGVPSAMPTADIAAG